MPEPVTKLIVVTRGIAVEVVSDSGSMLFHALRTPESEALAHLFAAAPALLSACESALACLAEPDGDVGAVRKLLEGAIARARGGSNG